MTVSDGWDALVQLRDALSAKRRKFADSRGDLDGFQVFEDAKFAGKAYAAQQARAYLVDRVSPMEPPDAERDGDGWDELEDFQDFVRENYLRPTKPGDVPDFKPGEKGFALGVVEESQDIVDDVERVFEFEGPDADPDALAHENVDDPDEDPVITEEGRVLKLGRRDPAGLQDELEQMAEQDVIDVDAEEIDVEGDIEEDQNDPRTADAADALDGDVDDLVEGPPNHPMETPRHTVEPMTDENEPDSDDQDEQLTDELRGVSDPDADNAPDALLDRDEDDGDDRDGDA